MSMLKIMTIDGFYTREEAERLGSIVSGLGFQPSEFGDEIPEFNMVSDDASELFSHVLNKRVQVIDEDSGVFRFPRLFVHFEGFDSLDEWLFVIAVQPSAFNMFEHKSGVKTALEQHEFNYRDMFEWDLIGTLWLEPGQGVFFRPWLFHSFDSGLIQKFRLKELKQGGQQ